MSKLIVEKSEIGVEVKFSSEAASRILVKGTLKKMVYSVF
jgi:hypothetical protein